MISWKMGGAGPGRAEPDLVALAVQPNLARQVETQVADPQVTLRSEVSYVDSDKIKSADRADARQQLPISGNSTLID